jgi:ribosomal protein L37AE/L43A
MRLKADPPYVDITRNTGPAYSDLPSFPEATPQQETCLVCNKGEDSKNESNSLLECEKCEEPWHLQCLDPPLDSIPDGEWHCPHCLDLVFDRNKVNTTKKRSAVEEPAASTNGKKKATTSANKKGKGKGTK